MTESERPQNKNLIHIPKGVSGNPGGKPVGARNRISKAFLHALANAFDKHGKKAIEYVATKKKETFIKVCASILPKELEITRPLGDFTDEQLDAAAEAIRAILAAQADSRNESGKSLAEPAKNV